MSDAAVPLTDEDRVLLIGARLSGQLREATFTGVHYDQVVVDFAHPAWATWLHSGVHPYSRETADHGYVACYSEAEVLAALRNDATGWWALAAARVGYDTERGCWTFDDERTGRASR